MPRLDPHIRPNFSRSSLRKRAKVHNQVRDPRPHYAPNVQIRPKPTFPLPDWYPTLGEQQRLLNWIYGTVHDCLPGPLKEKANWTDDPREREQARLKVLSLLADYHNNAFWITIPKPTFASTLFDNILFEKLESEGIYMSVVPELLRLSFLSEALQEVPGIGSVHAKRIALELVSGISNGMTPGEYLISHPHQLITKIRAGLLPWWIIKSGSANVRKKSYQAPNRRTIQNLRDWWVDNGGTA